MTDALHEAEAICETPVVFVGDLLGIDGLRKWAERQQRRIASLQRQLAVAKALEVKILRALKQCKADDRFRGEMAEAAKREALRADAHRRRSASKRRSS